MNGENNMDEKARFLSFLIASTGSNITASEEVLNQEMENFKCVKQVDTNDALVDALVAISQVDSQQERMEIIVILMMKLVTLCNVIKMQQFIMHYPEHMFDYIKDHPEVREKNATQSMQDAMDGLFGL